MTQKFNFSENPPQEYFCPVSFDLLVSAKQTSCCGKHLSQNVADELESKMKPCPLCNTPNLDTHKDIYFRRLVSQLHINCNNKTQGCEWEGELLALERHLSYGSVEGDCLYEEVQCPYICRRHITRNKLTDHMNNHCEKRPSKCNYCNEEGSYGFIVGLHLPICDKFPTKCPRSCGELLCRNEIKNHISTQCPLREVACEFSYAGCKSNALCQKQLKRHMEDNSTIHLSLLVRHCKEKEKELEALKAQVQLLTNGLTRLVQSPACIVAPNTCDIGFIPPSTMIMTKFSEFHSNREWRSPGFYTHIGGYKMCLLVLPDSKTDDAGSEVTGIGTYLQLLQGEYDSLLKWPFHGKIVVRMLNQISDSDHIEQTVDWVSGVQHSCIILGAIKIPKTSANTTVQYLREDSLRFQIVNVNL